MNTYSKGIPTDPKASPNARRLMAYLDRISGNRMITGQHTQTRAQEELVNIEKVTGELPALCGFELLSYSPHMQLEGADEECLKEIEENRGTLEQAWDWAYRRKGLITFTWHWYSPIGGHDKSFYTVNTDFDASLAVTEGTKEREALIRDMDQMAEHLKVYAEHDIPILWRPFHEGDGDWFWWGAKGADTVKKLWRMMYERYTQVHELHNLIWVFNCPSKAWYPGDDVVDIISRDMYPEKHCHTDSAEPYRELVANNSEQKLAAIGEIGVIPSVEQLAKTHIPWCWYMTWSKDFCLTEEWNTYEELCKMYHSPYALTLRTWQKESPLEIL
ncbi:MAG: glycosyl hydrolase [Lachnospiraceae bacterium]